MCLYEFCKSGKSGNFLLWRTIHIRDVESRKFTPTNPEVRTADWFSRTVPSFADCVRHWHP